MKWFSIGAMLTSCVHAVYMAVRLRLPCGFAGRVKWWKVDQGFGFIELDDRGKVRVSPGMCMGR